MYIDADQLKAQLLAEQSKAQAKRKEVDNPLHPMHEFYNGKLGAYSEMLAWLDNQPKLAMETTRTETHTKTREYYSR